MVWRGEDTAQTASFDSGQAAPQSSRPLVTVGVLAAAVAALYFLREIFIPIALAVLLSFMLGPAVTKLRRFNMAYLRMNSGETSISATPCPGLSARAMACAVVSLSAPGKISAARARAST